MRLDARRNPDGSITMPMMAEEGSLPPGLLVDGEVTVFPGSPRYAAAEQYLAETTDPFKNPADVDEEQP